MLNFPVTTACTGTPFAGGLKRHWPAPAFTGAVQGCPGKFEQAQGGTLLLDEITSALDPELVGEVLDLVRELAESGRTIVMATHEMGFARQVAHTVCFLDGGRIIESGPPEQVFDDPQQDRTRQFLRRVGVSGSSD